MYIYNSLIRVGIESGMFDPLQIVRFWIERSKFNKLSLRDHYNTYIWTTIRLIYPE